MIPLTDVIQQAYRKAADRKWDRVYWAIDIHETVLVPSYDSKVLGAHYPHAARALELILSYPESRIILWSSLSPADMQRHKDHIFWGDGFTAEQRDRVYLNCNPECGETEYASFNQKFYFNILLDDKAGFDAQTDWKAVMIGLELYRRPLA
jgi:hypothetical protein